MASAGNVSAVAAEDHSERNCSLRADAWLGARDFARIRVAGSASNFINNELMPMMESSSLFGLSDKGL